MITIYATESVMQKDDTSDWTTATTNARVCLLCEHKCETKKGTEVKERETSVV